jgi:hypothetical protein
LSCLSLEEENSSSISESLEFSMRKSNLKYFIHI